MEMTEEASSALSISRLAPLLWRASTLFFGIVAIAVGLLYAKQDNLLYFPEIGDVPRRPRENPRRYRSPGEHDIPFEDHMIECEDGIRIHSWLLLQPQTPGVLPPTIVFFHGNAGNIGLRLPNAIQMYNNLKANVLLVEYRGYGDSDDTTPTEAGLRLDGEAAVKYIFSHPKVDKHKVFLFGRSLGGAVAYHAAHYAEEKNNASGDDGMDFPLAGVMVENTFVSISRMVDHLMPYVAPLKTLVLRIGWDSSTIATNLRSPILYLAGDSDQLVPHDQMKELFAMSLQGSRLARMHIVAGGTHNETWLQGGKTYWKKLVSFMSEVMDLNHGEGANARDNDSTSRNVSSGSAASSETTEESAIPTTSSNLFGLVGEAMTSSSEPKKDL